MCILCESALSTPLNVIVARNAPSPPLLLRMRLISQIVDEAEDALDEGEGEEEEEDEEEEEGDTEIDCRFKVEIRRQVRGRGGWGGGGATLCGCTAPFPLF